MSFYRTQPCHGHLRRHFPLYAERKYNLLHVTVMYSAATIVELRNLYIYVGLLHQIRYRLSLRLCVCLSVFLHV